MGKCVNVLLRSHIRYTNGNVIKRARLTSIFHALSPLWREISDAMTVIYEAEFLMSATGVSSAPRN